MPHRGGVGRLADAGGHDEEAASGDRRRTRRAATFDPRQSVQRGVLIPTSGATLIEISVRESL